MTTSSPFRERVGYTLSMTQTETATACTSGDRCIPCTRDVLAGKTPAHSEATAAEYEIVRVEDDGDELITSGSLVDMYAALEIFRAELPAGEDDTYKIQPYQGE